MDTAGSHSCSTCWHGQLESRFSSHQHGRITCCWDLQLPIAFSTHHRKPSGTTGTSGVDGSPSFAGILDRICKASGMSPAQALSRPAQEEEAGVGA